MKECSYPHHLSDAEKIIFLPMGAGLEVTHWLRWTGDSLDQNFLSLGALVWSCFLILIHDLDWSCGRFQKSKTNTKYWILNTEIRSKSSNSWNICQHFLSSSRVFTERQIFKLEKKLSLPIIQYCCICTNSCVKNGQVATSVRACGIWDKFLSNLPYAEIKREWLDAYAHLLQ